MGRDYSPTSFPFGNATESFRGIEDSSFGNHNQCDYQMENLLDHGGGVV